MVESTSETVPTTPVAASPKKTKKTPAKAKAGAAKKASTHPPTAAMVNNAIKTLNERGGSSLQAIKKSISGTYKLDAEKLAPFIKKYLKSAVEKGTLIRTKGKGASGSFKLANKAEPKKKTAAPKKKKAVAPKKEKSADAKPKKAKATPKKAAAKKAAKPKAASKPKATPATPKKAVSKVKKTKATPSKKPKSPKPKKTAAKKPAKKTITKK